MLIALGLFLIPTILVAQDEELKKPKDAGIKEYDDFKNNAFGIYTKSLKFKTMVENGEKFSTDDVKEVDKLQGDLSAMKEKTEKMVKNAKSAKPMTKAPKATKNTQAAGKALKVGGENLKYVAENMVKENE